jgi:hypothetical protein
MPTEIVLRKGRGVVLVDDEDYPRLSNYKWFLQRNILADGTYQDYARTNIVIEGKRTGILMHQMLLGRSTHRTPIDHKDNDGLNNQRKNIRFLSQSQNLQRSIKTEALSGYRGVRKSSNKTVIRYQAYIRYEGEYKYLGTFDTPEEASVTYEQARSSILGELR